MHFSTKRFLQENAAKSICLAKAKRNHDAVVI